MMFGYAYPAYECFKVVEMNKADIEQLRFWCQYWILVAVLTVCERVGDAFVSWVPMYSEAKLAFFLYLWYPKTKGTTYVYDCFFKPFISNHEADIDRNLLELRIRAEDLAVSYSQRAVKYVQTRIFDILQYVASQSTAPRPSKQAAKIPQPTAVLSRKPSITKQQTDQPSSPSSTSVSSEENLSLEEEAGPSQPPIVQSPAAAQKVAASVQSLTETTKARKASEVEVMQVDSPSVPVKEISKPVPEEMMEEELQVMQARLRRTRTLATR